VELIDEFGFRQAGNMVKALFKDHRAVDVAHSLEDRSDEEVATALSELENELALAAIDRLVSGPVWSKELKYLSANGALVPDDKREEARAAMLSAARDVEKTTSFDERIEALRRAGEISLRGGKVANWNSKQEMNAVGDSLKIIKEKCKKCSTLFETDSEENTERAEHVARLLVRTYLCCREEYEADKRERSALDFTDLLVKALVLLRDNDAVRVHYRQTLKFVLVDEFQDTDALQVEIVRNLTGDERGDYTQKRLFVVGDAKQSIYKFRGADVSVFREAEGNIGKTGSIVNLDRTFRARPKLVSFVNDFFGELMGAAGRAMYEAEYVPLVADRETVSDSPEVEFLLVDGTDNEKTLEESRRDEAELIARRIHKMVESGERLVEDEKEGVRPVQHGDIAILFRAMTNISTYERALREHGIPYYLTSGGGFYVRQEVKDIICFLKVLENADDEVALAGVLRSPMVGLSDDALYWLKRDGKQLFESIKVGHDQLNETDREKLAGAVRIISELRGMKDRYSISRLIMEIVNRTGYLWVLRTMFLGRQRVSNVRKLAESARDIERSGVFTLRDFVNYVNELVTQEIREGEAVVEEEKSDVVKVTTIHKAKGLEYPVVFVADLAHGGVDGQRAPVLLHPKGGFGLRLTNRTGGLEPTALYKLIADEDKARDLAESKRLLYVACTRARDHLVLSGVLGKGKANSWMKWFGERYGLGGGETEMPYGDEGYGLAVTAELPPAKRVRGRPSLAKKYRENLCDFAPIPSKKSKHAAADKMFERIKQVTRSLRSKDRFSVTELECYGDCPKLYELKYVNEIPEEALRGVPPSVIARRDVSPAERGNVAHRVFELWSLDSDEDVRELIHRAFDERRVADRDVRSELESELVDVCERFKADEAYARMRASTDMRNEMRFSLNVDGAVVEGAIDRTFRASDSARWILDFKTDRVDADQAQERAQKYRFQLEMYSLAVSQLMDGSVPRASVYFLTPSVEVELPVDRDALDRVKTEAAKRISLTRSNEFALTHERCELCPYQGLCAP
jgi:ATP-dependent helicase/nuclease subunit A